ncbi:MAG: cytidylate kinase-like family protein [Desulfobacterales bacterium]
MSLLKSTVEKFAQGQREFFESNLTDEDKAKQASVPVVTVAMEPGSGGFLVAEALANRLGFDLYHRNILNAIAHSAGTNSNVLDMIEKERFSKLQDFVSSLLQEHYVYSGDYVQHLTKIVNSLGIIGRAVIVGRGANFILPPEKRFAIRVIAPEEVRVKNVAFHFGISLAEAKKRIKNREAKRKTFIKNTFHKDIADVESYDLILNTARLDLQAAVETAIGTILGAQRNRVFEKATAFILQSEK